MTWRCEPSLPPRYQYRVRHGAQSARAGRAPGRGGWLRHGRNQYRCGLRDPVRSRQDEARAPKSRLADNVRRILAELVVLPLEPPADEHYGDIRLALERAGTPIGPNDLLIAAQARALDLTLVTANEREFKRVAGLQVENWLAISP